MFYGKEKEQMNIFVTGTDTDIGKTITSAWICKNSNAKYWKPIQTGNDSDSNIISQISPKTLIIPNAYKLKAPLSPYDSGKIENISIDLNKILEKSPANKTVIEGAGGALVPVSEKLFMADLINFCNAKAIIVAKSKLGFLNHIFMTIETLKNRSVEILGIILNGKTDLISTIETFSKCKVLAVLSNLESIFSIELPHEIKEELK